MHAPVLLTLVVIEVPDGLVVQARAVLKLAGEGLAGVPGADDQEALRCHCRAREAREEAAAHLHEGHTGKDELSGNEDHRKRQIAILHPKVHTEDQGC